MNRSRLFQLAAATTVGASAFLALNPAKADEAIGCALRNEGITAVAYFSQNFPNMNIKKGDAIFRFGDRQFKVSGDKIIPWHVFDSKKPALSDAQNNSYEQRIRAYIAGLDCVASMRSGASPGQSLVKAAFNPN